MKANEAPETYPMQFRDKIDEYLWKEHHIIGGCCSSIEEMKYSVAREVAEKLTDAFIEKALKFIKTNVDRIVNNQHGVCMGYMDGEFKNYMEGE